MTSRTLRGRLAAAAALATAAVATGGLLAPVAAQAAPTAPQPPLSTSRTIAKFDWTNATIDVPWTKARLRDGTRCPSGRVTFTAVAPGESDYGSVRQRRATLLVRKVDTADVNRDGQPDTLVHFLCQRTNKDVGYSYYYVYSHKKVRGYHGSFRGYRPVVLDYVTSSDFAANALWNVRKIDARYGAVDVQQSVRAKRWITVNRTFRWSNHRGGLVTSRPLPIYPEADRAPR